MSLSFLCKNHRAWLNQHPDDAIQNCVSNCEAARVLYQQGRWQESLLYIGNAFETAEILFNNRVVMQVSAMEWFLHTLAGLIQTLKALGHGDACKEFYQAGIDQLKQERLNTPSMKTAIDAQIYRLVQERSQLDVNSQPDRQRAQSLANNQHTMVLH